MRPGKIMLAAHSDPDGDALGAMLGLYHLLKPFGGQICMYRDGALPVDYTFLPGAGKVSEELPEADWPEIVVLLDCHAPYRAGNRLGDWLAGNVQVVVLDHHLGEADTGFMVCKNPAYSATSELIALMARDVKWDICQNAAQCLFAGMVADTGHFTQGNTTAQVLELASWLVSRGAQPDEIALRSSSRSLNRIQLHAHALSKIQPLFSGRMLVTQVSMQDLQDFNCGLADLEGLVEILFHIQDEEIGLVLKQVAENMIKASIRSKKHIDVSALAMEFGGGGHKNAAGFKMAGSLDEVQARFVEKAARLLEQTSGA